MSQFNGQWDSIVISLQDICQSNQTNPLDHLNVDIDSQEIKSDEELRQLIQNINNHKENVEKVIRLLSPLNDNLGQLITLKRASNNFNDKGEEDEEDLEVDYEIEDINDEDDGEQEDDDEEFEDKDEQDNEGTNEGEQEEKEEDGNNDESAGRNESIMSTENKENVGEAKDENFADEYQQVEEEQELEQEDIEDEADQEIEDYDEEMQENEELEDDEEIEGTVTNMDVEEKEDEEEDEEDDDDEEEEEDDDSSSLDSPPSFDNSHSIDTSLTSNRFQKKKQPQELRKGKSFYYSPYNPSEPVVVGSEVAFRPKSAETEWIQCQVTRIFDMTKFEIKDPEPDENGNPGKIYRCSWKDILLIPPKHSAKDLVNYSFKTKVLARYPETTTFYKAEVIGTKRDGKCRLRFDGEEEVGKETEVERRLVLPFPDPKSHN